MAVAAYTKGERTRRRLLGVADGVFRAVGFREASVRAIAAEAGVTTGALYGHFEDKSDLFLAVLERHLDRRLEALRQQAATTPEARVPAAVGDSFAAILEQEREWVVLLIEFWTAAVRDPALLPRFVERHAKLRSAIGHVVGMRADAAGTELPLAADDIATLLIALANGFAIERLADPEHVREDLHAEALALLFAGIRTTSSQFATEHRISGEEGIG